MLLEDYLGEVATVSLNEDWFTITLPGKPSYALKRLARNDMDMDMPEERWFEVCCIHKAAIDVITRQADEFTNNIAKGFAELVARWFKGDLDET